MSRWSCANQHVKDKNKKGNFFDNTKIHFITLKNKGPPWSLECQQQLCLGCSSSQGSCQCCEQFFEKQPFRLPFDQFDHYQITIWSQWIRLSFDQIIIRWSSDRIPEGGHLGFGAKTMPDGKGHLCLFIFPFVFGISIYHLYLQNPPSSCSSSCPGWQGCRSQEDCWQCCSCQPLAGQALQTWRS